MIDYIKKHPVVLSFIIFITILGIHFIYNSLRKPYMSLIIKFREVPPVIDTFPRGKFSVYFRGYKVGKVDKVFLSKDQKYIVFILDIYYKNLKLPKNTKILMESEDIYGAKHFSLVYPKNPSNELLSNMDEIHGNCTIKRIDKYIIDELKKGRLRSLLDNLIALTESLKSPVQDINIISRQKEFRNFIKQLPQTVDSTVQGINEINLNIPSVNKNINEVSKEISEVSGNISETRGSLINTNDNILTTNQNITKVNESMPQITQTITQSNSLLYSTNSSLSDLSGKIPHIPKCLIENANKSLIKFDCLSDELTNILSKRFLIPRFTFGKPASSLKDCINNNNPCCQRNINP